MTVPSYQDFMLPTLKLIADNCEHKSRDIVEQAADMLGLTDEDKQEKLPSQTQATYYNRAMWARTYLKKACLLDYTERGVIKITQRGLDLLQTNPDRITKNTLLQYDEFKEFQSSVNDEQSESDNNTIEEQQTLDDMIEYAQKILSENLKSELLDKLKKVNPVRFEEIVLLLMEKMNYGVGSKTKLSHDGGIDGIVHEDELGFEKIYLQAKRYSDNKFNEKEMVYFIGALDRAKVRKGVFITTSYFSTKAEEAAKEANNVVIKLIDGNELTKLMIKHNVGVQLKQPPIEFKKVDEDFFIEGE